ncbi:hypothetical protein FRC04_000995 [Tulasnella sp. 424]|nr:hypothetical protein FRC04_000995 [Tulasnella sp. 424]KAG8977903.1 hypothetical protein FRC05_000431 [Tulasnella sp. 425]
MSDAQSLDQRREEAKAAFLATLAAAQRNPNGKEIVEELTRLLGNMEGLGDGGMTAEDLAAGFAGVPDLKDEFGNPIIEINEPFGQSSIARPTGDSLAADDVQHLWDMPPDVAAAKRREIDMMWEELEEEEETYFRRQKYLEAGPSEPPSSKKKAADRQRIESRAANATTSQPASGVADHSSSKIPAKKKGVSFADGSAPRKPIESTVEWGDVVPATLSGRRRKPIGRATPIMKFGVVERTGKALEAGNSFAAPDSDDEEISEQAGQDGSDDEGDGVGDQDSDDEAGRFEDAESDEEDEEVAELRRQVFSDYRAKRQDIFQRAREAGVGTPPVRTGNTSDPPKVSCDDEFVPLDATPANPHPASGTGTSRFKASHTGQSHSVTVRAIGPDAHETIREGKLVEGQLVAPADSDSDADGLTEVGKQALDRLRKRGNGDAASHLQDTPKGDEKALGEKEGGAGEQAIATPNARVSIGDVRERTSGDGKTEPRTVGSVSGKPSRFKAAKAMETSSPAASSIDSKDRRGPSASPSFAPTVIESPSFSSAPTSSLNPIPVAERIMARDIVERTPGPPRLAPSGGRVSRFKADRM